MAMSRQLKLELARYHRSKLLSVDGSTPGMPYNHYQFGTGASNRDPGANHLSYDQHLYLRNPLREYHPHLNAPVVD